MTRPLPLILLVAFFANSLTAQQQSKPQEKPTEQELAIKKDLHYRNLFFFSLAKEESRQKQLDVSPIQLAKIKEAEKLFWDQFQEVGEERSRIISLFQKGQLEKEFYERLMAKNKQAENSVNKKFNSSVQDILLPHQLDRISLYARRRRLMSVRDEFEVPILIAKEKGIPKSQISKLERHIQVVRKEFYAKLNEQRGRRSKIVMNSMDKDVRKLFEKHYKEIYDFRAEEAAELIGDPIK